MSEEIKNNEVVEQEQITEENNVKEIKMTQDEFDAKIKAITKKEKDRFEKAFKNSDEWKDYNAWKENKKTEEERISETLENYSNLKKDYDKLSAELNSYKNKDVLRGKEIESKYVDFVNFEVEKMVNEETDYNAALEKYLESNPQYAKDKDAAKITTGQRHPGSNNDLDDLDKLRKQMGVPLKEGK